MIHPPGKSPRTLFEIETRGQNQNLRVKKSRFWNWPGPEVLNPGSEPPGTGGGRLVWGQGRALSSYSIPMASWLKTVSPLML